MIGDKIWGIKFTNRKVVEMKLKNLGVLAVACVIGGFVQAESLTVTSGQAVTVDTAKSYDSVTLSGGTIVLADGGTLTTGGISVENADSTIRFDGGRLASSGRIWATGCTLTMTAQDGDVDLEFPFASWEYLFGTASSGKIGQWFGKLCDQHI